MAEELHTGAGAFTAEVAGPAAGPAARGAPLVLLLHGFPQTHHTWRHQLPALGAAGYRAVAPDQRGYSPGARPDPQDLPSYGVDRLVGDALDLAVAAGCPADRPFHLVGHDWGGAVAWLVASRYPQRLASLTVLSRPHPGAFRRAFRDDAGGQQHRSRHHRAFLDPATGSKLLEDGARRLRRTLTDQGVPADACDQYLSVLAQPAALEAALAWYRAAAGDLGRMEAGPVDVPTLYVWGDADATVSEQAARWTGDHVTADYRFEPLAGVGHFATDQAPGTITRLLLEHLRAHPA
jgi:pimeloyl-ACP methyl ester carboxylesterase